ncbi:Hop-interacting protein THI031 [Rhynchospora pubera]|uniref:Hop-interacting protein THI031 n=1 Tax=Rhynchospora pubera TaxID=906938 RepID=A0AAV8BYU9_9POAL|nr:Hop-interacting protein THI031 [Rhynchospora pubera]
MRREGRQHGYVRTHVILSEPGAEEAPEDRPVRIMKSKRSGMTVAGVFAKVSRKPTNHSIFTGKCSTPNCVSCRDVPASKAKSKAKGMRKFKFGDDEGLCEALDIDVREAMDNVRYNGGYRCR